MRILTGSDGYTAAAALLKQAVSDYPIADLAKAAIALRAAAPSHRRLWASTDDLVYAQVPDWHWKMLTDRARTRAYRDAIRASVKPGMRVLEIGAGTGVLAMMAAEAGAEHVWTVEVNPLLAGIAEQCISRNGYADHVTVLNMHSASVVPGRDMPGQADLLVHEILCRAALSEGLAPTLSHAREALLVPHAPLLPDFIGIEAVLCGDLIAGDAPWWKVDEFDLSPLALLDAAAHQAPEGSAHSRLSLPVGVAEIDLRGEDLMTPRSFSGPLTAQRSGTVAGVEQWMKVCFPGGVVLSSDDRTSSWGTCYHPFGTVRDVEPGDRVDIEVSLDIDALSIGLADQTGAPPRA
ncbi:MAG: 50S ribosomal protein L11 methyltransferase [Pseudomonadota bacterium]